MSTIGRKRTPDGQVKSINTNGEAGDGGHHETQLDPIKRGWMIHRGPPDYTHARLPWMYEQKLTATDEYVRDYGFRMTSPYDPVADGTSSDLNIGVGVATAIAAGTADAKFNFSRNVAYWDYYASMYNYYSVLACRYKVRVENLCHEKFYVHSMFVTNTNPPSNASNWDMLIWKGVKSQLVHPKMAFTEPNANVINQVEHDALNMDEDAMPLSSTDNISGVSGLVANPVGSSFVYFTGEYRPGQADQQIHEDADVSIYTAVTTNPSLREILLLRIKPYDNAAVPTAGDVNNYTRTLTFNITVECEYLVEFKELKSTLRWPTSRNPLTVTINTDPESAGTL